MIICLASTLIDAFFYIPTYTYALCQAHDYATGHVEVGRAWADEQKDHSGGRRQVNMILFSSSSYHQLSHTSCLHCLPCLGCLAPQPPTQLCSRVSPAFQVSSLTLSLSRHEWAELCPGSPLSVCEDGQLWLSLWAPAPAQCQQGIIPFIDNSGLEPSDGLPYVMAIVVSFSMLCLHGYDDKWSYTPVL